MGFGLASTSCPAGDATNNAATPYETDVDFVPVTTDESLGFHVVYSAKADTSGKLSFNVGIFLFPLDDGSLLVFGAGYGDPVGPGTALYDAQHDVANVDAVVRTCLGKTPANTPIVFVSPHWHGDHINTSFIRELGTYGYDVREIWYHEADDPYIQSYYSWTDAEKAKFHLFASAACNVEIGSFQSTLGKIWVINRSGHAPGAIDLVIDVRDNPNDRFLVLGSVPGGNCPTPPSGVRQTVTAHGNVLLQTVPQVVPYGCGVNATGSLSVLDGDPSLGSTITLGIDDPLSEVTPGALPILFSSLYADPAIPCGSSIQVPAMARPYEVLLSRFIEAPFWPATMGPAWAGQGQPSAIPLAIPLDSSLIGTSVYTQGLMIELNQSAQADRIMLTDALELRLAR